MVVTIENNHDTKKHYFNILSKIHNMINNLALIYKLAFSATMVTKPL